MLISRVYEAESDTEIKMLTVAANILDQPTLRCLVTDLEDVFNAQRVLKKNTHNQKRNKQNMLSSRI